MIILFYETLLFLYFRRWRIWKKYDSETDEVKCIHCLIIFFDTAFTCTKYTVVMLLQCVCVFLADGMTLAMHTLLTFLSIDRLYLPVS